MRESLTTNHFEELERRLHLVLETYSNVHRGSGHYSMVTTHLYDRAREVVLESLGLDKKNYIVIFCSPRGAYHLRKGFKDQEIREVSCRDTGLMLGVHALVVRRNKRAGGIPFMVGGGTARLIGRDWIVWAGEPERYEAGTPPVIPVIALVTALQMTGKHGKDAFSLPSGEVLTPEEILYEKSDVLSGKALLDEVRLTLIGSHGMVPTAEGPRPFINLDLSASTPAFSRAWDAFRLTLRQPLEVQRQIVSEVRSICAEMLEAPASSYDLLFTANTTESVNIVADSLNAEPAGDCEPVILTTFMEHSSNDIPWRMIPGHSVIRIQVNEEGFVDPKELEGIMRDYNLEGRHGKKRIVLAAVSGASNVLGTFNNIGEISRIIHQYGARLLVDAAQLVAHRRIQMERDGIDYLVFSAHKAYAPFGTGVLAVRKGLLTAATPETAPALSTGEENAAGIAALGKALLILRRIGFDVIREEEQMLTRHALTELSKTGGVTVFGITDVNAPAFGYKGSVIPFVVKGKMANSIAGELAWRGGIGIRYGCHCAHLLVKHLAHVGPKLERFQKIFVTLFPKMSLPGVDRVSFGIGNTMEDIDTLIRVLRDIKGKRSGPGYRYSKQQVRQQMKDLCQSVCSRVY